MMTREEILSIEEYCAEHKISHQKRLEELGIPSGTSIRQSRSTVKTKKRTPRAGKSVLGTAAKISGANLYSRLNYRIVFCGGKALSNPPALLGVEAPTEAVVTLTPTKFTFELESEPEDVANLKLVVMASAPQANGVTRAYGKAVQIAHPLEAVCEEYDIKEDFDNKHGALTPPPRRSS